MGTCLSKKKGSSTSYPVAETKSVSVSTLADAELKKNPGNAITVSKPKVETEPEVNNLKKDKKTVQEKQEPNQEDEGGQLKKEIFIIKHRKSHDDRERNSKCSPPVRQNAPSEPAFDGVTSNEANNSDVAELGGANKIVPPAAAAMGVGVRTSSCTKEEVDAILIQCGRLSRSSSGKAASSSAAAGERRRRYSGSKRSYDFDHCDNDNISADDDQKRANGTDNSSDLCEDDGEKRHHQHRPRNRQSPRRPSSSSQGRRRTPSRERDQQHQHQRSSSRERRVSRSPGRRSSETSNPTSTNPASAVASNNSSNSTARPGKMVSVPPTVSSLAMDKSNNGGGGESAATTGIKRISVKRNVGDSGMVGSRSAASPRSQSPARANGNGNAANSKAFSENHQQQPSLSRSSSRKAEQSPYRRNPLSEIDPNSLAYPQSANNKKPNVDVNDNTKNRTRGVSVNCKPKEQQEVEVKGHSAMTENDVVKTVVPSGVDNLKPPQTLTRSRSSRRSRDLDINPEALLNPEQSYTSLLLEDIHNFHQKNTNITPSVPLPACVTKACSILEAVADLNSTTSSSLSGAFSEDRRSPPMCQSTRNEYNNVSLGANHYGKKRVTDTKDPFVESEVVVHDDVMEPSLHKYVTVKRGGSVGGSVGSGGVDMEDQESSGSNSFTVSAQQNWGFSSSWELNSADSTDCWTSRLNPREEGQKSPLGLNGSLASEGGRDIDEARKKPNGRRRECDHQHSSGIGRGKLGANKGLLTIPVTAAAST